MDEASLSSLSDSLAGSLGETLDEDGLVALFQSVTGLTVDDRPEAVTAYEAALQASLDPSQSGLEMRPGGWVVDLKASTAKFAVSAAVLTGVMVASGYDQIPAYVLPAVLPLLFDVERAKLNRGDRKLLVELRTALGRSFGQPADIDALYDRLPARVRDHVPPTDFADFIEKLVTAGEAEELADDRVALREDSEVASHQFQVRPRHHRWWEIRANHRPGPSRSLRRPHRFPDSTTLVSGDAAMSTARASPPCPARARAMASAVRPLPASTTTGRPLSRLLAMSV